MASSGLGNRHASGGRTTFAGMLCVQYLRDTKGKIINGGW